MSVETIFTISSAFVFFGYLPSLLAIYILTLSPVFSIHCAAVFSFVTLAFINIILALGLYQAVWCAWIAMLIINLGLLIWASKKDIRSAFSRVNFVALALNAMFAFLTTVILLWSFWPGVFHSSVIYADALWNLGTIGELQRHMPPVDPHWHENAYFRYHFLSNLYIAALSTLSHAHAIAVTTKFIPFIVTFCCIFSLSSSFIVWPRLIVAAIILYSGWFSPWIPGQAFVSHISEMSASTFYWSLPVTIFTFQCYFRISKKRIDALNNQKNAWAFGLALAFILIPSIFAKASTTLIWIFSDFFLFLYAIIFNTLKNRRSIRSYFNIVASYCWAPLTFLAISQLYFGSAMSRGLQFGLSSTDFSKLGNQPWLVFICLIPLLPTLVLLIGKRRDLFSWALYGSLIIQIILFLITNSPGSADFYFLFNAFLIIAAIILYPTNSDSLTSLTIALLVYFAVNAALPSNVSVTKVFARWWGDNRKSGFQWESQNAKELEEFGKVIPPGELVVLTDPKIKNFSFSAMMRARIWNESFVYTKEFMDRYGKERPHGGWKEEARTRLVRKYSYSDLTDDECHRMQLENKWKWALLPTSRLPLVGNCLRNQKSTKGASYVLFQLD